MSQQPRQLRTWNGVKTKPNLRSRITIGKLVYELEQLRQEFEDFIRRNKEAHKFLSEKCRMMQNRVEVEPMLQAKMVV
jgi:hypothetical protein